MSERGEYRAIVRALIDGPDFQRLSERANHLFLLLKINFGPYGIEVWYPGELELRLARQGNMTQENVASGLSELAEKGWIQREENVVWIVGHLEHDPNQHVKNENHRIGLVRHIAGLPRLQIIRTFVQANIAWFQDDLTRSETLSWAFCTPRKGIRRGSRGYPNTISKPETGDADTPAITRQDKTRQDPGKSASGDAGASGEEKPATATPEPPPSSDARKYPHFSDEARRACYAKWGALGKPDFGRFVKTLAPLFPAEPEFTLEQILAGIGEAIRQAKEAGGYELRSLTPQSFVERARYWVGEAEKPFVVDGWFAEGAA